MWQVFFHHNVGLLTKQGVPLWKNYVSMTTVMTTKVQFVSVRQTESAPLRACRHVAVFCVQDYIQDCRQHCSRKHDTSVTRSDMLKQEEEWLQSHGQMHCQVSDWHWKCVFQNMYLCHKWSQNWKDRQITESMLQTADGGQSDVATPLSLSQICHCCHWNLFILPWCHLIFQHEMIRPSFTTLILLEVLGDATIDGLMDNRLFFTFPVVHVKFFSCSFLLMCSVACTDIKLASSNRERIGLHVSVLQCCYVLYQ